MKYYDKIFFLISLVVLGASLGYYFISEPQIEQNMQKADALLAKAAKGIQWKEVAVPRLEIKPIEWPEVRAQDEEGRWFFQVFTPPQIWIDDDGKFITESPYIKEKARQSFALKYDGVSNEPYPIKYMGFIGSPDDPRVQLKNESTNAFYTGKIKEAITTQIRGENGLAKTVDVGLMVKSFDRKRVKNSDNTISEIVKIVGCRQVARQGNYRVFGQADGNRRQSQNDVDAVRRYAVARQKKRGNPRNSPARHTR